MARTAWVMDTVGGSPFACVVTVSVGTDDRRVVEAVEEGARANGVKLERVEIAPPSAEHLFEMVAGYLLASGWYRDGQDLGVWIKQAGTGRIAVGIDAAVGMQFLDDGIDPLQVAAR